MQISNNSYNYNVDFLSRVNTHNTSARQGTEQEIRGVEKNESSEQTKSNPQQEKEDSTQLTADERIELNKLQTIDAKVRAHEAAHLSGPAASGGASFTYQKGPDGVMYAIGGEVPVRIQTGSTPQETIANMQGVIATALAPADPSPQDISIASKARVIMMKAQQEFAMEIQEKIAQSNEYSQKAKSAYEENSSLSKENKTDSIRA